MVTLSVLKAGPTVARHQTVGETARVTPTTQTGLERTDGGKREETMGEVG